MSKHEQGQSLGRFTATIRVNYEDFAMVPVFCDKCHRELGSIAKTYFKPEMYVEPQYSVSYFCVDCRAETKATQLT